MRGRRNAYRSPEHLVAACTAKAIPLGRAQLFWNQIVIATPAGLAASISGAALASPGTIGAAATTFMTTQSIIATFVAIAGFGVAAYEYQAVRNLSSTNTSLSTETAALRAQVALAQNRAISAEAAQAHAEEALAARAATRAEPSTRLAPAGFTARTGTTDPQAAEEINRLKRVEEEVAKRRAIRESTSRPMTDVAQLDTSYHWLYRQLNLSPEQIEQFKSLARENANRHLELDRSAAAQGLKVTDPVMADLYKQADSDFKANMASSFGDHAISAIQHFHDTNAQRGLVMQIATPLLFSPTPLTFEQVNGLTEIVWQNMPRDVANGPAGGFPGQRADSAAMWQQAQAILYASMRTGTLTWRPRGTAAHAHQVRFVGKIPTGSRNIARRRARGPRAV